MLRSFSTTADHEVMVPSGTEHICKIATNMVKKKKENAGGSR